MPGNDDAAAATPAPAPMAASGLPPVQFSNPAANRSVGGGRGRSPAATIFTLIFAALCIGIPLAIALHAGKKAVHEINSVSNLPFNGSSTTTSAHSPSSPSHPGATPTGVATGSLVRPFAVAKFVKNDLPGEGKLTSLRVSPENIQAETRTASGGSHHILLDYQGTKQVTKISTGGFGSEPTIALSKIDSGAPARMIKHIPRHTKDIDYLVLNSNAGALTWYAYYKTHNSRFYKADAHGRHVQGLG